MDAIVFFAGLAILAIPVSAIAAIIIAVRLSRRVTLLETKLAGLSDHEPLIDAPFDEATDEAQGEAGPWDSAIATKVEGPQHEFDAGPLAASSVPLEEATELPPKAVVFRREKMAALSSWVKENWFLAIAALSLALAGIFLVQYGIENGLITPFWRVIGGIALGGGLVGVGERLRRRFGDTAGDTMALPSTFSGAGVVVLFASILAARQLYDLIGAGPAFAALVVVAGAAITMGWLYGPFLSAVGLLGATLAPFVVGGTSDSPWIYMYYFALVATAGLAIDTLRRWAWVSVLALICGFTGSFLVFVEIGNVAHFMGFNLAVLVAAILIPVRSVVPSHSGTLVLEAVSKIWRRKSPWPEFPTRLAFGTSVMCGLFACFAILIGADTAETWLVLGFAVLAALTITYWSGRAEAISDAAIIGPALLFFVILWQSLDYGSLYAAFHAPAETPRGPAPIWQVTILAGLGAALSGGAMLRSLQNGRLAFGWAIAASLVAPISLILLELSWTPAHELSNYVWAGHPMAVAALMVAGAVLTSRTADGSRARLAFFVLAALTMISFAFVILLTKTALTLALAVMVLVAAWLDRRFGLRPMMYFVLAGTVVVTFRLLVDPGYSWAVRAEWLDVILAYGGTIAVLILAHRQIPNRKRTGMILASTAWFLAALFANVVLRKALGGAGAESHWGAGLIALVWLSSAANQAWRLQIGGWAANYRALLAILFSLIAAGYLATALLDKNPLLASQYAVIGPPVIDSLALAYLLPAVLLAAVAMRFEHLPTRLRQAIGAVSALLGAFWMATEIRRLWHGKDLSKPIVLDGELYSYTLAMLVVSVVCLLAAFSVRSHGIRQIAIIGIGLTIAKVFLIDTSGLAGLYRVASFLGLGLSLAGLAWAVRQINARWETDTVEEN